RVSRRRRTLWPGGGIASRSPASSCISCFRLPVVSSLWTPDGERPVGKPSGPPPDAPDDSGDDALDDDALAAQVEAMRAELASAPVEVVVANHCYGLFELAAVYLSQQ